MTIKKRLAKSTFLLLCICAWSFTAFTQKIELAEKKWLIDKSFAKEHSFNKTLTKILEFTIAGKYPEAKQIIATSKKKVKGKELAALLTFEATIAYNESQYQKSIDLSDSTIQLIGNKTDRFVLRAMNTKSKAYSAFNDYKQAKAILDTIILLSNEVGDQYNYGSALFYYGVVHCDLADNKTGIQYLQKSIKVRKEIDDQLGLASSYSFIGLSYASIDNYTLAIDYIQKSITIRQENNDKRGLANSYLTMYKIYNDLGEVNKAMEMELKSLELCKELGDQQCISGRFTNLGQLYQKKGDYKTAINYHQKALALSKKLGIKNRAALVHENLGKVYTVMGKLDLASAHLDSSLFLRKEIGERDGEASTYLSFAEVNLARNENKEAISNVQKALQLLQVVKSSILLQEAHRLLSVAYGNTHKTEKAFFHYQRYVKIKDSLFNADQSKQVVRQELEFAFAQKEEKQRKEQAEIKRRNQEKQKRQQTITFIVLSVAVVLGLLLLFSIRQFILKNRSKLALEKSNELLNEQNNQLEENKRIIENQHHEITDSIRYAQRIQEAVLPDQKQMKDYFPKSFVLFYPKDVISGDFYWMHREKNYTILVTADCTGHGVPGGFMSMLGISLLNDIVIDQGLSSPAAILTKLREKVISSLKQKGDEGEQKDGMDMTICRFEHSTKTLQYATANHVIFKLRDGELIELRGDKQPVGIYGESLLPFTDNEVELISGDKIFTFTDGYPDQFGGPKGKKFKYSQLKELILTNAQIELSEQKEVFAQSFKNWKGNTEQTDDVTMIAFEV